MVKSYWWGGWVGLLDGWVGGCGGSDGWPQKLTRDLSYIYGEGIYTSNFPA